MGRHCRHLPRSTGAADDVPYPCLIRTRNANCREKGGSGKVADSWRHLYVFAKVASNIIQTFTRIIQIINYNLLLTIAGGADLVLIL